MMHQLSMDLLFFNFLVYIKQICIYYLHHRKSDYYKLSIFACSLCLSTLKNSHLKTKGRGYKDCTQ